MQSDRPICNFGNSSAAVECRVVAGVILTKLRGVSAVC